MSPQPTATHTAPSVQPQGQAEGMRRQKPGLRHIGKPLHHAARQRGAATLFTVMVLLLVMAMVAAHAGRDMVFEQRMASNYHHAATANEAAEAGLAWAQAQLNSGRVDADCEAASAGASFRDRYLRIAADQGYAVAPASDGPWLATCTNSADGQWSCQCPDSGLGSHGAPGGGLDGVPASGDRLSPSFAIRLAALGSSGQMRVVSRGCSGGLGQCGSQAAALQDTIGMSELSQDMALLSALQTPPGSPLIAGGAVTLGTGTRLVNRDESSGALLLQAGGAVSGDLEQLHSLPGTPPELALLQNDASLKPAAMFHSFFGLGPERYRAQPAVARLRCQASCSAALNAALGRGQHLLWIDGPASLDGDATLASVEQPLLLLVDGPLVVTAPIQVHGLIYARGPVDWHNSSGLTAVLKGALIAEGQVSASGAVDLNYDRPILQALHQRSGSFVPMLGGWQAMR